MDQEGQGVLKVVEQVGTPLLEHLHIITQVIILVKCPFLQDPIILITLITLQGVELGYLPHPICSRSNLAPPLAV